MRRIAGSNGVEIALRDDGQGQAVLFLHGFPDTGRLWRHQVAAVTAAGMRALVPDLRGRGASDRPHAVEDYAMPLAVADMLAVLDACGVERAHVVGHDFGAVVAWLLAALHPDRVERLVVMSVGHPATGRLRNLRDREMAWYQLLIQFDVAEELFARDDWRLFREWLRGNGDAEEYLRDLSRPGALTAGFNWYRANLAPQLELVPREPPPPVPVPTLGMWSDGDDYLAEHRMVRSSAYVNGQWRYERISGASHWLQLDQPDRVNAVLLGFLRGD